MEYHTPGIKKPSIVRPPRKFHNSPDTKVQFSVFSRRGRLFELLKHLRAHSITHSVFFCFVSSPLISDKCQILVLVYLDVSTRNNCGTGLRELPGIDICNWAFCSISPNRQIWRGYGQKHESWMSSCSGLNGKIYVKFYNKVGEGVIVLIRAGFSPNNWFWPSSIGLRGFLWRIHSSSCITTSICFIYRAERWASINLVFAVTNMVLRGIKMGLSAPVADQPYVLNIFLRDPPWPCCILYSWHASEKGACAEEGWGDARG